MSNILLYVSGSIACYKSCALISLLTKEQHSVKVVASENALKFVGKASFEGLSHNWLYTDMFSNDDEPIAHITLSQKWADLIIAYPASANTINKLAAGIADNLFGALCLANNYQKPLLIAPAMNSQMFAHPSVQESLAKLRGQGAHILPCEEGQLACGTIGTGRLLEPENVLSFIHDVLSGKTA